MHPGMRPKCFCGGNPGTPTPEHHQPDLRSFRRRFRASEWVVNHFTLSSIVATHGVSGQHAAHQQPRFVAARHIALKSGPYPATLARNWPFPLAVPTLKQVLTIGQKI